MNLEDLKLRYDKVPNELKSMKRWVCFNVETLENGKATKRPYNALNGKLARVNDSLTWTTFNLALNGCIKYKFHGLGFVLGDGIFGVDLDNHADDEGNDALTEEEFNKISNEFISSLNSYTEFSQSGKGIHIICSGKLPIGSRRKGCVEMYDNGRFFAFTGNAINNIPIKDGEQNIIPLWEKYIKTEIVPIKTQDFAPRPVNSKVLNLSDEEIIEHAMAGSKGEEFYRYYREGDLSMNGGDASRADLAFCNLLAFWTNKDAAQMDRIFRNSALYRAKWDEYRGNMTYGEKTIATAINSISSGFEKVVTEKTYSIKNTQVAPIQPKQEQEEQKEKEQEFNPEMNIDENGEPIFRIKKVFGSYPYTDTGNALRFYDYFGSLFKYNVTDKIFMFWTGKTWIRDNTNIVRKYANRFIDILKEEENEILEQIENYTKAGEPLKAKNLMGILDACRKNATRVSNKAGKDAMLSEFQSLKDVPLESSAFNTNDYLLNTDSGIVDLLTGEISPFDKTKLCSKNTGVKVSYETPELWLKFLHEVFDAGDEKRTQELVDSFQTCLGYSLSGSTKEQVMFLLYGSGSNGKSTVTEQIAYILGDYADNIANDVLMAKKNANNSTFSIAKLQTTRFVTTGETDEGGKLAEGQVKILTGGDSISAQFKYGQEFSFKPKFKIWMFSNNKPIIKGTDFGIWRRVFLFPFTNTFMGDKKDKNLPDKLKKESDKILGWCIKGFLKYQELGGLIVPSTIQGAIKEYQEQMDVVSQFISKECKLGSGYHIDCKTLYNLYKEWADDNTEYRMKASKFSEELKLKGITMKKNSVGKFEYFGITQSGFTIGMK